VSFALIASKYSRKASVGVAAALDFAEADGFGSGVAVGLDVPLLLPAEFAALVFDAALHPASNVMAANATAASAAIRSLILVS
jgi:hypothetical protein